MLSRDIVLVCGYFYHDNRREGGGVNGNREFYVQYNHVMIHNVTALFTPY